MKFPIFFPNFAHGGEAFRFLEVLASLGEMNFAWAALLTAAMANVFAAIKAFQVLGVMGINIIIIIIIIITINVVNDG